MEENIENKTNPNANQGANIRMVRQLLGIKQEYIAEELGVTQQAVSYIEQQKVVAKDMLMRIAAILNVPCALIENMEENPLSVVIENNTFENGSANQVVTNPTENLMYDNQQIYPVDKIMELNKEMATLYERMLTIEKEKSALLEKLLNEKK